MHSSINQFLFFIVTVLSGFLLREESEGKQNRVNFFSFAVCCYEKVLYMYMLSISTLLLRALH